MVREIKMASVTLRERDAKAIVRAMNNLINRIIHASEQSARALGGEPATNPQLDEYRALRHRFYGAMKAAGIEEGSLG